jgi:hypothetical protein
MEMIPLIIGKKTVVWGYFVTIKKGAGIAYRTILLLS